MIERARSEQRLGNINTPSTNLLPVLDVVNEVIPAANSKKMNLKQINKKIQKQQPNAQIQLNNSKQLTNLRPLSPS